MSCQGWQWRDDRWIALDDATMAELRAIWWRARRCGHDLPPQRGIILIDGGREDRGWTPAA